MGGVCLAFVCIFVNITSDNSNFFAFFFLDFCIEPTGSGATLAGSSCRPNATTFANVCSPFSPLFILFRFANLQGLVEQARTFGREARGKDWVKCKEVALFFIKSVRKATPKNGRNVAKERRCGAWRRDIGLFRALDPHSICHNT